MSYLSKLEAGKGSLAPTGASSRNIISDFRTQQDGDALMRAQNISAINVNESSIEAYQNETDFGQLS